MPEHKTPEVAQEQNATPVISFVKEELQRVAQLQKEYSPEQLKFAKDLINPDLADKELYIFLDFCGRIKLNPFLKEIIAIVYNKDKPAERTVNYIITRNGKRVVASRTGELGRVDTNPIYTKKMPYNTNADQETASDKPTDSRGSETMLTIRVEAWEGGTLWGAESEVERNGVKFRAVVPLSEYNTGRNVWASKPSTMICKVAESQALSMAFPEILGTTYDDSEMSSMDMPVTPLLEAEDKPATPEQIATLQSLKVEVPEELKYNLAVQLISDATRKGRK